MKTGKWLGWALSVAILPLWAACSRDVGECWLPSEDGQGAGVGGGPIVPGAGGYGDVPPEPQDATDPQPDCDPDDATELGEVQCGKSDWGSMCSEICAENGVACPPSTKHPKKDDGGKGQLFKCCGCKGNQRCWYIHDNGDVCIWFKQNWFPEFAICGYQGGK